LSTKPRRRVDVAVVAGEVEHRVRIEAPPDIVFSFFVDEAKHPRWMGRTALLDPRPGGVYRVEVTDTHTVVGEYVVVEPPTQVVFTWGFEGNAHAPPGSSTVTVRLEADGAATLVSLNHRGLPHPLLSGHDEGWQGYLEQLGEAAGTAD